MHEQGINYQGQRRLLGTAGAVADSDDEATASYDLDPFIRDRYLTVKYDDANRFHKYGVFDFAQYSGDNSDVKAEKQGHP